VTADVPRDGGEAALLVFYRRLKPHEQRAFADALHRQVDGASRSMEE
jgi:hypothetical protein